MNARSVLCRAVFICVARWELFRAPALLPMKRCTRLRLWDLASLLVSVSAETRSKDLILLSACNCLKRMMKPKLLSWWVKLAAAMKKPLQIILGTTLPNQLQPILQVKQHPKASVWGMPERLSLAAAVLRQTKYVPWKAQV